MNTVRIILGVALVAVAVLGALVGDMRTWQSVGFGLIGIGFAWRGIRGQRASRSDADG